jgi:DNA primase
MDVQGEFRPIRFAKLNFDERWRIYSAGQITLSGPDGGVGRQYLTQERGLDVETIANFRFGYVPFKIRHAFSGRIVMPIFDAYSNLLALSVRPATSNKAIVDEVGKYWNESYDKGKHLFGLNLAKPHIIRWGFAILVEGQMDVATMHAYGLQNTVGVLGGAFTPFQAMLLKRWTKNILTMFDGDTAGKKHTERCQEVLKYFEHYPGWKLSEDHRFKRKHTNLLRYGATTLPAEKDPADFCRRYGARRMREIVSESLTNARMTVPKGWL